ncbi:MAG: ATP-dependent 6-phosphofructokinase [Alphaproteobacteria bacterium]
MKKIGILTSGGDCSGLNAIISSVVRSASKLDLEVYGIKNGTEGLTSRPLDYEILTVDNFCNTPWPNMSGSYLGSLNKGATAEQLVELGKRFAEGVKLLELDAVIVIGGDGSMSIVGKYCQDSGVKMIGIPKTMDNDTPLTETSVGFNSACQVVTDAIEALDFTARSHQRALILEVMGRDAGHLAIQSAVAAQADICLVPEIPYTIDGIVTKLEEVKRSGKNHSVIVVSEGVRTETGDKITNAVNAVGEPINGGIGEYLNEKIKEKSNSFQTRVNVLGHVQRAGRPTTFDKALASMFGARAIELLKEGKTNKMVAWRDGCIKEFDIIDVVAEGTTLLDVDSCYVNAAKTMGMYIGEL